MLRVRAGGDDPLGFLANEPTAGPPTRRAFFASGHHHHDRRHAFHPLESVSTIFDRLIAGTPLDAASAETLFGALVAGALER
jgi:hypothetical protein